MILESIVKPHVDVIISVKDGDRIFSLLSDGNVTSKREGPNDNSVTGDQFQVAMWPKVLEIIVSHGFRHDGSFFFVKKGYDIKAFLGTSINLDVGFAVDGFPEPFKFNFPENPTELKKFSKTVGRFIKMADSIIEARKLFRIKINTKVGEHDYALSFMSKRRAVVEVNFKDVEMKFNGKKIEPDQLIPYLIKHDGVTSYLRAYGKANKLLVTKNGTLFFTTHGSPRNSTDDYLEKAKSVLDKIFEFMIKNEKYGKYQCNPVHGKGIICHAPLIVSHILIKLNKRFTITITIRDKSDETHTFDLVDQEGEIMKILDYYS